VAVVASTTYVLPEKRALVSDLKLRLFEVPDLEQASVFLSTNRPNIIVLPVAVAGFSALPFIAACLEETPEMQVIVVVKRDQINEAAEAMRIGVVDCLFQPFSKDRLHKTLALAVQRLRYTSIPSSKSPKPNAQLKIPKSGSPLVSNPIRPVNRRDKPPPLIGSHPATRNLRNMIHAVAASSAPVLLSGESGSGKTHAAKLIHASSPLAKERFYHVNCAAVTDQDPCIGTNKQPNKCTIYFEDICDLSAGLQARLIRLFDMEACKQTRIITSTSFAPNEAIRDGRLRPELFHRISATQIQVPPLRDRSSDIAEISMAALEEFARSEGGGFEGFTPQAMQNLRSYVWPGNIRQLINVIRNIAVLHGENNLKGHIDSHMLPRDMIPLQSKGSSVPTNDLADQEAERLGELVKDMTLEQVERFVIEAAIRREQGSVTRAAKTLGVAPSTLYRKKQSWE